MSDLLRCSWCRHESLDVKPAPSTDCVDRYICNDAIACRKRKASNVLMAEWQKMIQWNNEVEQKFESKEKKMSVTAKFFVESITQQVHGPNASVHNQQNTVTLKAVTTGSDENKQWSKYTPWGEIKLSVTNPDAFEQFKLGAEVYISFDIKENK